MMDPKHLKKWLLLIGFLYLIFPRDLIPDFAGRGLGFIDDLGLIGLLTWYFRNHAREYVAKQGARAREQRSEQSRARGPDSSDTVAEPHAVLGIERGATQAEIRAAYRARMREYHPDKVAHLGADLQKLAHRRSLEIQAAYQRLRR